MVSGCVFVENAKRLSIEFNMANFKQLYSEKIKSQIQKELGFKNVMQVPRLDKIVLNVGLVIAETSFKFKGMPKGSLIFIKEIL